MKTSALKALAKGKLKGVYLNAVFGMVICYIPVYMFALITEILTARRIEPIIVLAITILVDIFVVDIFSVGYMRSLLDLNGQTDNKRYDANIVLSGFGRNYSNIFKAMFLRRLYTFGWGCLMFLPLVLTVAGACGVIISQDGMGFVQQITDVVSNPTESGYAALGLYITKNYSYLSYIIIGGAVLSLLLTIVYIRKVYLYEMIPMIMAETPDMSAKDAFTKTKQIMTGYRFKYFVLVLSFIWILFISSLVAIVILSNITQYIAMALVMPYVNMSLVQFYLWRTNTDKKERIENNEN